MMAHFIFLLAAASGLLVLFALAGAALAPSLLSSRSWAARTGIGASLFVFLSVFPHFFVTGFAVTFGAFFLVALAGLSSVSFKPPGRFSTRLFWCLAMANLLLLTYSAARNHGLGDHDPYEHAMGISYIFETGSIFPGTEKGAVLGTLDPYPPGYDAAAATVAKFYGSVADGIRIWCIVAAALFPLAVRFFARSLGASGAVANLAGAFVLLLPPAPTHFAWTHTLALSLGLFAAGALMQTVRNAKWTPVAAVLLAAFGLTATSEIIYSLPLFLAVAAIAAHRRKLAAPLAAVAVALLLFSGWGMHLLQRHNGGLQSMTPSGFNIQRTFHDPPREARPWYREHRGNARPYAAWEFLAPPWVNYFNIPVGFPAALFLPALLGFWLLWRRGIRWPALCFVFYMVMAQGERLPAEFFPHRAWSYLALLVAFGAAYTARAYHAKAPYALLVVFAVLSIGHAVAVRGRIELAAWNNEVFSFEKEKEAYYSLPGILKNQKTYPVAGGVRFGYIPAFGGRIPFWEPAERNAQSFFAWGDDAVAIAALEGAGYHYIVIDSAVEIALGAGSAERVFRSLTSSPNWRLERQADGFALFSRQGNPASLNRSSAIITPCLILEKSA